jgi:hypothetical protein
MSSATHTLVEDEPPYSEASGRPRRRGTVVAIVFETLPRCAPSRQWCVHGTELRHGGSRQNLQRTLDRARRPPGSQKTIASESQTVLPAHAWWADPGVVPFADAAYHRSQGNSSGARLLAESPVPSLKIRQTGRALTRVRRDPRGPGRRSGLASARNHAPPSAPSGSRVRGWLAPNPSGVRDPQASLHASPQARAEAAACRRAT